VRRQVVFLSIMAFNLASVFGFKDVSV